MLSFFDYLRHRVFDAVLSGVEDALKSLEKDPYSRQLRELPPETVRAALAENTDDAAHPNHDEEFSLAADNQGEKSRLPAPRLRGRPRKKHRS